MQEPNSGDSRQYESGAENTNGPVQELRTSDSASDGQVLCPHCAAQMPETAAFCPACGRTLPPPVRARARVGRFRQNLAGALAYLTFVPAILFLLLEPYKRDIFLRFHAAQCLLLWAGAALVAIAIRLAAIFLFAIPVAGPLFVVLFSAVAILLAVVMWSVLVVKALQGETFKLPIIGAVAEKHANAG